MEVTLRSATAEDAAGLARVSVDSWRVAYRGLVPQDYLDALSYEEREWGWDGRLRQSGLEPWVLQVDGRIGGFVILVEARSVDGGPGVGELEGIYLHPTLFGLGLGRRLMELALERLLARGHTEAVLWVLDGNRRAERFYEAAGWQREDVVRPHPRLGGPLRRYRRSLEPVQLDSPGQLARD
jgi:GNAT superfamily N-acetyltransferase